MLKYGKDIGLPETYRITLALSVAFLAHTLFMATFPYDIPEQTYNPVTVRVQLTPKGSKPASNSTSSAASSPVIAEPFAIENPQSQKQTPDVPSTTADQAREIAEPEPTPGDSAPASTENRVKPQTADRASASDSSAASSSSVAGQQAERKVNENPDELTMKSSKPTEEMAYETLLSRHIGRHPDLSKRRMSELGLDRSEGGGPTLKVNLELRLMKSGTLVEARVAKSSGDPTFDRLVYKAALGVSPYPKPPSSLANQRWFEAQLVLRDF